MIMKIVKKDLNPSHIEDLGINTLAMMDEFKIRELPVVNGDNKLMGLVTEDDILNMDDIQKPLQFISNKFKNKFIFLESHMFEIIRIFSESQLSLVPVVNQENHYIGYVRPFDVIQTLGEDHTNDLKSIITISMNRKNYTLFEITRLIEENKGKIVGLWNNTSDEIIIMNLLIATNNINIIIKTLERYDYNVTRTFIEKINVNNNLDDRFESFLKYLNP